MWTRLILCVLLSWLGCSPAPVRAVEGNSRGPELALELLEDLQGEGFVVDSGGELVLDVECNVSRRHSCWTTGGALPQDLAARALEAIGREPSRNPAANVLLRCRREADPLAGEPWSCDLSRGFDTRGKRTWQPLRVASAATS